MARLPRLVISATAAVRVGRGISPTLAREGVGEEEGSRDGGREEGEGREATVVGDEGGAEAGSGGGVVGEGLPGSVWSFTRRIMWWSLWRRGMGLSLRSL